MINETDQINDISQIKDYLENQFEYIYKWLSFAEAKNAALVAFNVAMLRVANDIKDIPQGLKIFILIFLIISLLIALESFFPNLSSKMKDYETDTIENKNLIFFQDIAQVKNEETLLNLIKEKYFPRLDDRYIKEAYLLDLTSEILINSRITLNKYKSFKNALWFDVGAVIFIMLAYLFS